MVRGRNPLPLYGFTAACAVCYFHLCQMPFPPLRSISPCHILHHCNVSTVQHTISRHCRHLDMSIADNRPSRTAQQREERRRQSRKERRTDHGPYRPPPREERRPPPREQRRYHAICRVLYMAREQRYDSVLHRAVAAPFVLGLLRVSFFAPANCGQRFSQFYATGNCH